MGAQQERTGGTDQTDAERPRGLVHRPGWSDYQLYKFDERYDLRSDPHEMINLADRPEHADVKRELVRKMWRFAAATNDHVFNPCATVAMAPWGPADGLVR